MSPLPAYVYISFGSGVLWAFVFFWRATGYARWFLILILLWTVLASLMAVNGFYDDPRTMTYRFPLLIIPVIVLSIIARSRAGIGFMERLDLGSLTLFHTVRAPVELALYWLSRYGALPHALSFWSGENFDILAGLSAPIVYYFAFVRHSMSDRALAVWNIICLILLFMPVVLALLSLPARYRFFGFGRPDVAIGYFPFILLPAALVPLAFFAHFATLRRLRTSQKAA